MSEEKQEIDVLKEIKEESETDIEAIRHKYGIEIEQDALAIIVELNKSYGSNKFKVLELITKLKDTGFDTETIKTILLENVRFCSKATMYRILPKEFKQDYTKKSDKLSDTEKVANENLAPKNVNTSNSGQQTVQEPNPTPEPEPVYNQVQTIVPEPTIDESKAPDQGYMGKDTDDSEIQYYDTEKEDLKKELELANSKILELSQQLLQPDKDLAIETLQKEIGKLRTELAQARLDNIKPEEDTRYRFSLKSMFDACKNYIRLGSTRGYIVIRDGKIAAISGIKPQLKEDIPS
jgi:hypothetical protein